MAGPETRKSVGDLKAEVEALGVKTDEHAKVVVNTVDSWIREAQEKATQIDELMEQVILLLGETVSKGEVYAQALHNLGPEGARGGNLIAAFMRIFVGENDRIVSNSPHVEAADTGIVGVLTDGASGAEVSITQNLGTVRNLGFAAMALREGVSEVTKLLIGGATAGGLAAQLANEAAQESLKAYRGTI